MAEIGTGNESVNLNEKKPRAAARTSMQIAGRRLKGLAELGLAVAGFTAVGMAVVGLGGTPFIGALIAGPLLYFGGHGIVEMQTGKKHSRIGGYRPLE